MLTVVKPVPRQSLSDDLAQRVRKLIQGRYNAGDRLPSISAMARTRFGLCAAMVRAVMPPSEAPTKTASSTPM